MWIRVGSFLLLLLACNSSCSLARDVTSSADARADDAGVLPDVQRVPDAEMDGTVLTDAGTDAALDAFVEPPSDAYVLPDRYVPVDTGPPRTPCTTTYGAFTGYQLCTETVTDCEFSVYLGSGTCGSACVNAGSRCSREFVVSDTTNLCTRTTEVDCNTPTASAICVCDRLP